MIYLKLSENIVNAVYIESIHGLDNCQKVLDSGGIKIPIDLWLQMSNWYAVKFIGDRLSDKTYIIEDFEEIKEQIHPIIPGQTEIEKLQEEVVQLTDQTRIQDELINVTMMATDEVFTLLEPLLTSNPEPQLINSTFRTVKEVSPMVDMYVAMVMRGLKTIDQVPLRYRPDVKAMLEALEE